jgi:hypothetical protein
VDEIIWRKEVHDLFPLFYQVATQGTDPVALSTAKLAGALRERKAIHMTQSGVDMNHTIM